MNWTLSLSLSPSMFGGYRKAETYFLKNSQWWEVPWAHYLALDCRKFQINVLFIRRKVNEKRATVNGARWHFKLKPAFQCCFKTAIRACFVVFYATTKSRINLTCELIHNKHYDSIYKEVFSLKVITLKCFQVLYTQVFIY